MAPYSIQPIGSFLGEEGESSRQKCPKHRLRSASREHSTPLSSKRSLSHPSGLILHAQSPTASPPGLGSGAYGCQLILDVKVDITTAWWQRWRTGHIEGRIGRIGRIGTDSYKESGHQDLWHSIVLAGSWVAFLPRTCSLVFARDESWPGGGARLRRRCTVGSAAGDERAQRRPDRQRNKWTITSRVSEGSDCKVHEAA